MSGSALVSIIVELHTTFSNHQVSVTSINEQTIDTVATLTQSVDQSNQYTHLSVAVAIIYMVY